MGSSSIVQSVGLHLSRREYWDRPKSPPPFRVSRASNTPPRCCCTTQPASRRCSAASSWPSSFSALIEREIRTGMQQADLDKIRLYPELRNCTAPSTERILEIFAPVTRHQASMLAGGEFLAAGAALWLDISIGAVFAQDIPDQLRSRVAGAYRTVNHGIRPVGALLGGFLGTQIGLRNALLVSAIGALCGALLCIRPAVFNLHIRP